MTKTLQKTAKRVRIGLTMGDPSGIGPEIVLKAASRFRYDGFLCRHAGLAIFADRAVLMRTARDLSLTAAYRAVRDWIIDCTPAVRFRYGKPDRKTARAALASVKTALDPKYGIDILITPPIIKETMRAVCPGFIGLTEYLAAHYGLARDRYAMMGLSGEGKKIMLLTTHLPLRSVPMAITPDRVRMKLLLLDRVLKRYFRVARPVIGVAAFNPHAFEFSRGEDERIMKGVLMARSMGIIAQGPFSADTLFNRPCDGFLAMYHDQAFVFLKARRDGLNVTVGLPLVRLSPLYGAALDIAGKGVADHSGMTRALREGVRIFENMQKYSDENKNQGQGIKKLRG